MKIKNVFFALVLLFAMPQLQAQSNLLNARSASEMESKAIETIMAESDGPMAYPFINDNDILYKKIVWETIPLDQKANLIYYFPTKDTDDKKSLFNILKDGVMKKEITEVYYTDDFKEKIKLEELKEKFTRVDTADVGKELLAYGETKIPEEYLIKTDLSSTDVIEYHIKGMWYVDRKAGELKYRMLGIAPVVVDINTKGSEEESHIELFWIFFPDARNLLYQNYAYNEKNEAMRANFDYLLNSRRFSSNIYKTNNIYDEDIKGLVGENATFQLLEAQRIKEGIRNTEDDLWSH